MASGNAQAGAPKLKDFVFTDRLGSGTYATVFKAFRKGGLREVVAVKCILKSSLNKISTENLLTEIELLKKLKNEYIVDLKDFQWDDTYIYLIMEYCAGGDLLSFIQSKRTLPESYVRHFLQHIAKAIQFMHHQNVSHLDLKPQNILLSHRTHPVLKIADFGFARYLQGDAENDILRGSPLYMAPEILIKRQYDAKADLWSIGVILYECLFGTAPFASKSFEELLIKIKTNKPVELPYGVQISSKCRDLLLRLLQRDPKQRIEFEDFFNHPFIELEHMPSAECLDKAIAIVKIAVEKDMKNEAQEAVHHYCKALQYFMPAIRYELNPEKKQALRKKVNEYMSRAEVLKQSLKPRGRGSLQRQDSSGKKRREELEKLAADDAHISAALKLIEVAEYRDEHEQFEGALEKYELALGVLIKIFQAEPQGRRRDLLAKELENWMSRAETIKKYLTIRKLNTQDTSVQYEEEEKGYLRQSCCLQ